MSFSVHIDDIYKIIECNHPEPFSVLGMHIIDKADKSEKGIAARVFIPEAQNIDLIRLSDEKSFKMDKIHDSGFFEIVINEVDEVFEYKLEVTNRSNNVYTSFDPYSFLPVLSEYDTYLYNEGNHHKIFEKLGAHKHQESNNYIKNIEGTLFAVWAPCAVHVSVVGSFNYWDGRTHQMRKLGSSGIWEIFIPGVKSGVQYKYEIKSYKNEIHLKSDPFAFHTELRPGTASIVYDLGGYSWQDSDWMKKRKNSNILQEPVSIYEVHLGSWALNHEDNDRFLTYREYAEKLICYVKEMGYTHIELMPLAEFPYDASWGYQVTGYYSVTSRFGMPDDFMYFVDQCHQQDIGVILDWVPAHFPKDASGLARFDGTALYEHFNSKQGEHPDWGTYIFNYERNEVKSFLVSNAVFWLEYYHLDGLRVDAVSSMLYLDYGKEAGEWIPNKWGGRENLAAIDFLKQLNSTVSQNYPGVMMVAEESTSWPLVSKPVHLGGLGFTFKWNMGWMNDHLKYIGLDPIYRKYHHDKLTFSIMYAFSESFILVLSHDEVVHGKYSMINKMPGDYQQKFAGLRTSYGYMYGHPGKKLLFMGSEFGQFIEWDYRKGLDWSLLDFEMHKKLQKYVKDLNFLYKTEKALYENDFSYKGFEWIDFSDSDSSIIVFMRKSLDESEILIFVCNFTPVAHDEYRIGVPYMKYYKEILNSDSQIYGGSNAGNFGGVSSDEYPYQNRPCSLKIHIPPLSVMIFKPEA